MTHTLELDSALQKLAEKRFADDRIVREVMLRMFVRVIAPLKGDRVFDVIFSNL